MNCRLCGINEAQAEELKCQDICYGCVTEMLGDGDENDPRDPRVKYICYRCAIVDVMFDRNVDYCDTCLNHMLKRKNDDGKK